MDQIRNGSFKTSFDAFREQGFGSSNINEIDDSNDEFNDKDDGDVHDFADKI